MLGRLRCGDGSAWRDMGGGAWVVEEEVVVHGAGGKGMKNEVGGFVRAGIREVAIREAAGGTVG